MSSMRQNKKRENGGYPYNRDRETTSSSYTDNQFKNPKVMSSDYTEKNIEFFNQVLDQLETVEPRFFDKQQGKNYLEKFKQSRSVKDVFFTLKDLLDKNLYPNKFIISQIIKQLKSNTKNYLFVKRIFISAAKNKAADSYIYNGIIQFAIENIDIAFAKKTYDKAEMVGLIKNSSLNMIIDVTGKNNEYVYAREKYNNAHLKKYDENKEPLIATHIYNTIINVAIINNEIKDAKYYYDEAEMSGLVTSSSLSMITNATGRNNEYAYAKNKFKNAQDKHGDKKGKPLINTIAYNTIIHLAIINTDYDYAEQIFNKIPEKERDRITNSHMMTLYLQTNRLDEAQTIYDKYNFQKGLKTATTKHGLIVNIRQSSSYGEAYLGLKQFIKNNPPPLALTIVHGKGSRSQYLADEDDHTVKKASKAFLKELTESYDITYLEDTGNYSGIASRIICSILPKNNSTLKRLRDEDEPPQQRKKQKTASPVSSLSGFSLFNPFTDSRDTHASTSTTSYTVEESYTPDYPERQYSGSSISTMRQDWEMEGNDEIEEIDTPTTPDVIEETDMPTTPDVREVTHDDSCDSEAEEDHNEKEKSPLRKGYY